MRICTIFTGGTIGSVVNESGYIGPKEGTPFRLLQLYREKFGDDIEFVEREPYRILSENLSADNLLLLVKTITEVISQKDIQGIIVTHGTDTLQYTSAVLGYVFANAGIPVVLVSSNYVLDDERANGLVNLQYGIEFIKGRYGKGVFVSYCNQGEMPTIHRATRLQPPVPYSDYVSSICDTWYGRFENGKYRANPKYTVMEETVSMFESVEEVQLLPASNQIVRIVPYVGMEYPELQLESKVILHGSFHSGTICMDDKLRLFAKKAKEKEIPFYLTGLLSGEKAYETVQSYKELGIISLQTSAEISQYCKLWLAISNNMDIQQVMSTSYAEDWVPVFG